MYSSGTTGKPKCIVHGAGGTLMKHLEEHQVCIFTGLIFGRKIVGTNFYHQILNKLP
jgi:hypothetical protein